MAGQDRGFEGVGQRVGRDAFEGAGKGALRVPEIVRQLQVEPEVGGHAAEPGQPGGHLGCHGGGASQHAVQRLAGDRELLASSWAAWLTVSPSSGRTWLRSTAPGCGGGSSDGEGETGMSQDQSARLV